MFDQCSRVQLGHRDFHIRRHHQLGFPPHQHCGQADRQEEFRKGRVGANGATDTFIQSTIPPAHPPQPIFLTFDVWLLPRFQLNWQNVDRFHKRLFDEDLESFE